MISSIINQDKKKDTKVNQETWNEGKFWLIVVTQQVGTAGNFIKLWVGCLTSWEQLGKL